MHRAALADEAAPELLEHAIRLRQRAPEAIHRFRIVGTRLLVLRKRDDDGKFIRLRDNPHLEIEPRQRLHDPRVERRDALRHQRHIPPVPVGRRN